MTTLTIIPYKVAGSSVELMTPETRGNCRYSTIQFSIFWPSFHHDPLEPVRVVGYIVFVMHL